MAQLRSHKLASRQAKPVPELLELSSWLMALRAQLLNLAALEQLWAAQAIPYFLFWKLDINCYCSKLPCQGWPSWTITMICKGKLLVPEVLLHVNSCMSMTSLSSQTSVCYSPLSQASSTSEEEDNKSKMHSTSHSSIPSQWPKWPMIDSESSYFFYLFTSF